MFVRFRIPFLDPNELAAKGATLLHHLALWMIEEKKTKEVEEEIKTRSETLPKPPQPQPGPSGVHRHRGSECDRPDSGFDSKDEDESKTNLRCPLYILLKLCKLKLSPCCSKRVFESLLPTLINYFVCTEKMVNFVGFN